MLCMHPDLCMCICNVSSKASCLLSNTCYLSVEVQLACSQQQAQPHTPLLTVSNFPCPFNSNFFLFAADKGSFHKQLLTSTAYPSCRAHPVPRIGNWTSWHSSLQLCRRSTMCCECLPSFLLHPSCTCSVTSGMRIWAL